MEKNARHGYILVTTMLILAVATIIVTGLLYRASSAVPFVQSAFDKEKALMVAQSGISYVQALATFQSVVENGNQEVKKNNAREKKEADKEVKVVIGRLLPLVNQWTTFALQKSIDGVDGVLRLYVSSEEGKININKAYDFNKKSFITGGQGPSNYIDDQKKLVLAACQLLEKTYKTTELFEKIEKFLSNFDGPLNDISDLLCIPGFERFQETVFPNVLHDTEKQLYLADMFTVVGNRTKLNPWFLSRSTKQLCGIKERGEEDKQNTKMGELIKQFSRTVSDWESEWKKLFVQRYQTTAQQLAKGILSLFDVNCVPQFFTIISVGQVNNTSSCLAAFIEVIETRQNNQISYESRIKKWYVVE